ncbi:MFS transporter [Streptomyces sp. NPDC093252]|uniref:MFS transporter n=1 Tax=Streptomyces sp. NPDC093252 TaxID=3154980 RepID=UPI00344A919E
MTTTRTSAWTGARVLRDRTARRYLGAVLVNGFGTNALWLAAGVWVKELTGSDGLAALCVLAMWAPTVAGPLLGPLADRVRRKPLLVGLNLGMAVLLPVLVTVDSAAGVWLILAVLLAYGTTAVLSDAAEAALMPSVLPGDLLGDFNGLRITATEGMKLAAPLAGAGLYAAYGGAAVAVLDAVTCLLAAALIASVRVRERAPERPSGGWWARTAAGGRELWSRPALRPLVLAGGAAMLCAGVNGALVYAVVEGLGRSPAYAGLLAAVQGGGSVLAGLAAGPALRRLGERRFAVAGIALTGAAVLLRAVPWDAAALVSGVAIGAGLPCVLIAALTAVQRSVPDAVLGRTAATASTVMFAPNVIGLVAGAALVGAVPYGPVLLAVGPMLLLTALQLERSAARTAARSPSDASPA